MSLFRGRLRGGRVRSGAIAASAVMALAAAVPAADGAQANWLTKAVREAGDSGAHGVRTGLGALDHAARHVAALPPDARTVALGAHATPEGHWTFVNRAGEVFTAGTPSEMTRVVGALAPEAGAAADRPLALYLSADTVFRQRGLLKDLPKDARVQLVAGRDSYPLLRQAEAGSQRLLAAVRPGVLVAIGDEATFREALWQLARPLDPAQMRVIAVEPGSPDALSWRPRFDPATKGSVVDRIDPNALVRSLAGLRGQTAILTARIDGETLHFRSAAGADSAIPLAAVESAAAAADVRLVILRSAVPAQPGGRNWLWQTISVPGLAEAMKRPTVADFLDGLGGERGRLVVDVVSFDPRRTALRVLAGGGDARPLGGDWGGWVADIAQSVTQSVTGNVVTSTIEMRVGSQTRQAELDWRIVPGIPSVVQILYLSGLLAGLAGFGTAWRWWERLWPAEDRTEYGSAFGYHAARIAKGLVFVGVYLPLAGVPSLVAASAAQLMAVVAIPVHLVRRLMGYVRSGHPSARS